MRYFGLPSRGALSNQLITKEANAKQLFSIVSKAGSISRAQLAKISGLSPSTVSVLTEELIQNHILLETGVGQSSPTGRRPIMLEVDPIGLQIPSFAFRPTGLLCTLYDLKFNIVEQAFEPYPAELQKQKNRYITPSSESVVNLFTTCLSRLTLLDMTKVRIFTLAFYGAFLKNTRMYASSVLGWHLSTDFIDILRAKFNNIPLLAGNNAVFLAYAEKSLSEQEDGNLLYLHLDDGVGSGIVMNGQSVIGACGISGEIGSMIIDGKILETYISTKSILEALEEKTNITDLQSAALALQVGDPYVSELFRDIARKAATAVSNTLCMLGSMDVFIGGKTPNILGPAFIDIFRGAMHEVCYHRVLPLSPVNASRLPEYGDCFGAAKAYVDKEFTVILP